VICPIKKRSGEKRNKKRNTKVEGQTTLWEYYESSTIIDNLLISESTQVTEDAI